MTAIIYWAPMIMVWIIIVGGIIYDWKKIQEVNVREIVAILLIGICSFIPIINIIEVMVLLWIIGDIEGHKVVFRKRR